MTDRELCERLRVSCGELGELAADRLEALRPPATIYRPRAIDRPVTVTRPTAPPAIAARTLIVNTHDQLRAAGGGVAILRYPEVRGRGGSSAKWSVCRLNEAGQEIVTDPRAHWTDRGCKTFIVHNRADNAYQQDQAIAWVAQTFGITGPWVRNRMGDLVLLEINKRFPIAKREKRA